MPHYNLPHNHGQNIEKVLNGGNLKIYNARQGGAHVEALFKAE